MRTSGCCRASCPKCSHLAVDLPSSQAISFQESMTQDQGDANIHKNNCLTTSPVLIMHFLETLLCIIHSFVLICYVRAWIIAKTSAALFGSLSFRAVNHPDHPSVLQALEIEDPVVANCLIDQRGIESILLIKVKTIDWFTRKLRSNTCYYQFHKPMRFASTFFN